MGQAGPPHNQWRRWCVHEKVIDGKAHKCQRFISILCPINAVMGAIAGSQETLPYIGQLTPTLLTFGQPRRPLSLLQGMTCSTPTFQHAATAVLGRNGPVFCTTLRSCIQRFIGQRARDMRASCPMKSTMKTGNFGLTQRWKLSMHGAYARPICSCSQTGLLKAD